MIKAYEYLFYKLYQWSIKVNGENYFHTFSASLMIGIVMIINFFTILSIISILKGKVVELPDVHEYVWGVITLVCCLCNYIYFKFKNRLSSVLERYKYEGIEHAKRGNIFVASYVIGSFFLLIASWFIGMYLRLN